MNSNVLALKRNSRYMLSNYSPMDTITCLKRVQLKKAKVTA